MMKKEDESSIDLSQSARSNSGWKIEGNGGKRYDK